MCFGTLNYFALSIGELGYGEKLWVCHTYETEFGKTTSTFDPIFTFVTFCHHFQDPLAFLGEFLVIQFSTFAASVKNVAGRFNGPLTSVLNKENMCRCIEAFERVQ